MLGKTSILSLFPNSFNNSIKNEHSCKILNIFLFYPTSDRLQKYMRSVNWLYWKPQDIYLDKSWSLIVNR